MSLYQAVAMTAEEDKITIPQNWKDYPALRPHCLSGMQPPADAVLVKTGGNALQAIPRATLKQDNVVAVTVPWHGQPGQVMIVHLANGKMVQTKIPSNAQPGHVFLIQIPPQVEDGESNMPNNNTTTSDTPLLMAQEVPFAAPLHHKEANGVEDEEAGEWTGSK